VHLEQRRGVGPDRLFVVREVRAVRGADLAQAAARGLEDLGDAERAADLDQLAARHDHLASCRERVERQEHRARVVVHRRRGLGAGDAAQQRLEVRVALAALARLEVVFQIGRRSGRRDDRVDGDFRQERAPEIGVQHRPGKVEYAPQRRRGGGLQALEQAEHDGVARWRHGVAGLHGTSVFVEQRAQLRHHQGAPMPGDGRCEARVLQDPVDRRDGCEPHGAILRYS
jgi:hypothetical protein